MHRLATPLLVCALTGLGWNAAARAAGDDAPALTAQIVGPARFLEGHTDGVNAVAFSPDGTKVITSGHDQTSRLWVAATGKELRRLEAHWGIVYGAAFSADGRRVATSGDDGLVVVWDAETGEVVAMLEGHERPVYHVAFLPDGSLVSAGRDGTLRRWDVNREKELAKEEAHENGVYALAVSRDGKRIATGGGDGVLILWDAAKFKPLWRVASPAPAAQQPRELPAGRARPPERPAVVGWVAFGHAGAAPDAPVAKVYSLGMLGFVHEWDAADGEHLRELEAAGRARGVTVSPDGRRAIICAEGGPGLWELKGMRLLAPLLPADYPHAVAFSPDGRWAAFARGGFQSAGRGWVRAQDPRVPVWDLGRFQDAGK